MNRTHIISRNHTRLIELPPQIIDRRLYYSLLNQFKITANIYEDMQFDSSQIKANIFLPTLSSLIYIQTGQITTWVQRPSSPIEAAEGHSHGMAQNRLPLEFLGNPDLELAHIITT